MKKIAIIALTVISLALYSCSVSIPLAATNNKIEKKGIATRTIWFGLAFGHTDVGIEAAAKNGNITKVATVDYNVKAGLFRKTYTTTVQGE